MKSSKSLLTLAFTLACAAFTFSLALRAQAQTVNFIYDFHQSGLQSGAVSPIQGTDGNLYGAASGGAYSEGEIFRLTPNGALNTLYSFCRETKCPDGENPESSPILGSDGNLYGVTSDGGNSTRSGTFYKLTLGGDLTTLYTFCPNSGCVDGQFPRGIVQASDGNFYGTAEQGGKFGEGTIFRISSQGEFKLLYTFCSKTKNCLDGASPEFAPIQGIDGNFYGAAYWGGTRAGGVIYQLTPAGTYKVLYNFCSYSDGCPTGSNPNTIVQDAKGNFFGTTVFGGNTKNYGTVFELTSANQYRVLHTFRGWDGDNPIQGLTLASDGTLYGPTISGGGPAEGNLFKITPAGQFNSFFVFRCCNEGYDPFHGPLFQGTDGNLYGTTLYGSSPCCYGTIFSVSGLSPLVETLPVAGKVGKKVIILGNGLKGSTSVKFNGKSAPFLVVSDTEITATVPSGATTGIVSVVTQSGTLNSNPQFVVTK